MLAPYDAVQVVVEHLRVKGHQIEQVRYPMGSAPVIRVKGRPGAPGFRISFLAGVSGCGTRVEAADWERTVQSLRDLRAGLRDLAARQRYLNLGSEHACKALVMTGSAAGREEELAALAGQLGFSLMLIDDQHAVISAGLNRPDSRIDA